MDDETGVCGCACSSEDGWPEQDEGAMRFLIATGVAMLAAGGYTVARLRPQWLPLWLAALVTWFTACKYLICTRCENYGQPCDFYRLGVLAAKMFPAQPGRTLDAAGIAAEGSSVAILQFLPVAAGLRSPRLLALYLVLLVLNQGTQMQVCCRRCVQHSKDPWKADTCPSYRLAGKLFAS